MSAIWNLALIDGNGMPSTTQQYTDADVTPEQMVTAFIDSYRRGQVDHEVAYPLTLQVLRRDA